MQNEESKLTAIQIVSNDCIDDNLMQIQTQLSRLPRLDKTIHHIVLLPENALCLGDKSLYFKVAERLGTGPVQTSLSQLAKQYHCTLICGSFPIQSASSEKIYTTSLVYSPQGALIAHYHKMHLFDADVSDTHGTYRESDSFMAGQDVNVVDCGFAKIGLAICYDLRFPSLFQRLRELGADIIVIPAAFTYKTGEAHWQVLLQARAIETQCYVLAANQGGEHFIDHPDYRPRHTFGHSMIVNEWGTVITSLTMENGFVQADFNRFELQQTRHNMPVQQHNRFTCEQKLK